MDEVVINVAALGLSRVIVAMTMAATGFADAALDRDGIGGTWWSFCIARQALKR